MIFYGLLQLKLSEQKWNFNNFFLRSNIISVVRLRANEECRQLNDIQEEHKQCKRKPPTKQKIFTWKACRLGASHSYNRSHWIHMRICVLDLSVYQPNHIQFSIQNYHKNERKLNEMDTFHSEIVQVTVPPKTAILLMWNCLMGKERTLRCEAPKPFSHYAFFSFLNYIIMI